MTETSSRAWPTLAIATYDVSAKRQVASFEIGDVGEYPIDVIIVGNKLAVNLEQRIVLYNLDGSDPRELRKALPGGSIIGVGASRDGTKLALAEQTGPLCDPECRPYADVTSVVFLDVASGQELLVVPQSAPGFAEFRGQAWVFTWRDDGKGVVVHGATYSEQPGGTATVLLDGSVRTHEVDGYVSPNGRYTAIGGYITDCPLETEHEIALRALDTGGLLSSVHDDSVNFQLQEWSPDGTELLYQTYLVRANPNGSRCKIVDETTVRWYVLRTDGSPPSPVPDPEALRDQWYGAARPKLLCGDHVVLYPHCSDERGIAQPVDIYIADTKVDSGMDIQILGYIQ